MGRPSLLFAVSLWLCACAGPPLLEQDWLVVRSAHFEIWSTLGEEDTAELTRDLERFRIATETLWGRQLPAPPRPLRVLAYLPDSEREYRHKKRAPSYLIPDLEGDWILLRGSGGWRGEAGTQLAIDLARRIVAADPDPPLPWVEAGLIQVAGTIEIGAAGLNLGVPRPDLLEVLRTRHWVPIDRVLAAVDLHQWSDAERELFDAEAWALCQYLLFDSASRPRTADFARLRAAVDRGSSQRDAALEVFGRRLGHEVWRHVNRHEFDSPVLRITALAAPEPARRPTRAALHAQLGALSLATQRPQRALWHFERALAEEDGNAAALAGLVRVHAERDDASATEAAVHRALALRPEDPAIRHAVARALAALGERAPRESGAERSLRAYREALARDPASPAGWAGLASVQLRSGDPAAARASAARARALFPGDPGLQLLSARAAVADGDPAAGRQHALLALTRSRSRPEQDAARRLLADTETKTTRNR